MVGKKVESIKGKDFDPRGQYTAVVDAVKKAGNGDVGFFKAELDRTRVQYLVLSVDADHGCIVGLKVLSVES